MASLILSGEISGPNNVNEIEWNDKTWNTLLKRLKTGLKITDKDIQKMIDTTFESDQYNGTCDSLDEVIEKSDDEYDDTWGDFIEGFCIGGIEDFLVDHAKKLGLFVYRPPYDIDALFILNKKGQVVYWGTGDIDHFNLFKLDDGDDPENYNLRLDGFEGAVIKNPNMKWGNKRSTESFKVKSENDVDLNEVH